jgi:Fe-S-cluster-containing dehydrogenase component
MVAPVTSAELLHHGEREVRRPPQRLFIDLDLCASADCEACAVQCSYPFHPGNNGIVSLTELATYALVCRRCEAPHCVNACPRDALEQRRDDNNRLVRHGFRCVSCRSCSHACPYGTIYPEHVPQFISNCDFCLERRSAPREPLCVATCPSGALRLVAADDDPDDHTYLVGKSLLVHSTHWERARA